MTSITQKIVDFNVRKYKLTPAESIIFKEMLTGKSYKQIGFDVFKSVWTVKKYSSTLFDKLSIEKRGGRVALLSKVLNGLNDYIEAN